MWGLFSSIMSSQTIRNTDPIEHSETLSLRLEILVEERRREREQMQSTIDDLRARLDRSEERITALLAAPPRKKSWWPWG